MTIFNNFFGRFVSPKSNEVTSLPVESVTADIETISENKENKTVTVSVTYKFTSETFTVAVGTTMSNLFKLIAAKFSIGSLDAVAILNTDTNNVAKLADVQETPITEDTSLSIEDTSGTAG